MVSSTTLQTRIGYFSSSVFALRLKGGKRQRRNASNTKTAVTDEQAILGPLDVVEAEMVDEGDDFPQQCCAQTGMNGWRLGALREELSSIRA